MVCPAASAAAAPVLPPKQLPNICHPLSLIHKTAGWMGAECATGGGGLVAMVTPHQKKLLCIGMEHSTGAQRPPP